MRILFISQLYDPEYAIKGQGLMEHWVEQGHEVEVLTTFPSYPTGRVFDGYKSTFYSSKSVNKVKVMRVWSYISRSKSRVSRSMSYISFTVMALFVVLFRKKPDLIYGYHPQLTTGLIGVFMKKIKNISFITDVQDLWPDALVATGFKSSGFLVDLLAWLCKVIYRNAEHVIVLSQGYKASIVGGGIESAKVSVVYNWCPEEDRVSLVTRPLCIQNSPSPSPAHLVYAGNIGAAQNLKSVIEAVSQFSPKEVTLTLVGDGVEKEELCSFTASNSLENIVFKNYLPAEKIFDYLGGADILLIHLKDEPLFKMTIPSKTQSSMAVGKPLLMAVGGEANQLVLRANCGEVAEAGSVASISAALMKLLACRNKWGELGNNARNFYQVELSKKANYKKIDNIILKFGGKYSD